LAAAKIKKAPEVNAANTEREFPQLTARKGEADELSSSGCRLSQPAAALRPGTS
jgi:hypothetical protein